MISNLSLIPNRSFIILIYLFMFMAKEKELKRKHDLNQKQQT
jgi:hypothetical protein